MQNMTVYVHRMRKKKRPKEDYLQFSLNEMRGQMGCVKMSALL
jgi:hypothetical protein